MAFFFFLFIQQPEHPLFPSILFLTTAGLYSKSKLIVISFLLAMTLAFALFPWSTPTWLIGWLFLFSFSHLTSITLSWPCCCCFFFPPLVWGNKGLEIQNKKQKTRKQNKNKKRFIRFRCFPCVYVLYGRFVSTLHSVSRGAVSYRRRTTCKYILLLLLPLEIERDLSALYNISQFFQVYL